MDELTRKVLESVAEGVWCQHNAGLFSYSQCAFCGRNPHEYHESDCEVILARKVLDRRDLGLKG